MTTDEKLDVILASLIHLHARLDAQADETRRKEEPDAEIPQKHMMDRVALQIRIHRGLAKHVQQLQGAADRLSTLSVSPPPDA